MKQNGNSTWAVLTMLLILASASVRADLIASVDRDRISLGDTLQLTLTATGNERLETVNLNPLNDDFQILQRSTASSTRIINGRRTTTRQMTVDLVARWQGTLRIPPLNAGSDTSNYLLISVGPAQTGPGKEVTLSFDAELDKERVYVQGQAILTLRIQQAINLDSRSITELQLDNAFVKQLEQQSFQRTIDGRPWLIHEIRYAIFPEASGTLEIPAQTFSARESSGRRSMLSLGGGRKLQRTTQPLTLQVLPIPDTFQGATWLPAESVVIEEAWSTPPDQLQVGQSATRTVTVIAQGLQSAQLPPVEFPTIDGLKTYPDQALTEDLESAQSVSGSRTDSVALIPTQEGRWTLPEVRIPWWDVDSKTLRHAVLASREIVVTAGQHAPADAPQIPLTDHADTVISVTPATPATTETERRWQYIALGFALAWLATVWYLFSSRSKVTGTASAHDNKPRPSENDAFKNLVAACTTQDYNAIRVSLIRWTGTLEENSRINSLDDVADFFQNSELTETIKALNASLYGAADNSWQAQSLVDLIQRLRKNQHGQRNTSETALRLYPS